MRGGANNYLKDIEFKLINPYITTNKEIAEEFKKDPQSIKNYVEIINPKKHDLNIEKVEAIDTDTIKLDVSFFQNGEKIGPAVKKLNGLRDSTKPWTDEELAVLFKHMLEQSKNNIKEFIDLSSVKDKFPSDVNVIKFNSDNIASRKIPNILFEATINSDSIDDVNGTLSLSISLRSKIPSGYSIYNAKHNIDLGPVDGLWSWNKIISDIKEEDLELPKNSNEFLLPSSCDTKSIKIKKGSNFQNKYNDIEITFDPVSHSQNDDWNGIKNITFNLNYKNKKVSPKANLSLKNFYSLYKLQELISEKNINIPEFPHLLPSKYSDSDIKLKNELLLLKNNPNLKIIKKLLADDTNGILNVDITLIDEKNNLNYHKNFVLTGFYSTKKFDDLKNNLDIENSDEPSIPHLLPSKYEINNIKLKSESLLLKNNPNLKIIKKLLVDDANGILNVDITLIDEKNNLNYHKNFVLTGFYSTKKFDDLKNNLDIENSDEPSIPH
uniref:lipoprotein 17-related variable surface protein n=1 Tax=Mycoplasmopsis primatum TaxID=55604 RepID=UPI00056B7368